MIFLIENPNFDSPNNSFGYLSSSDLLELQSKRVLAGLSVSGQVFRANAAWCKWAEANGCLPLPGDSDDVIKEKLCSSNTTKSPSPAPPASPEAAPLASSPKPDAEEGQVIAHCNLALMICSDTVL